MNTIDPASDKPIFRQIEKIILGRIQNGTYAVGSQLPSERALSQEFQVNRRTLSKALNKLAEQGAIERRIGSGSYVQEIDKEVVKQLPESNPLPRGAFPSFIIPEEVILKLCLLDYMPYQKKYWRQIIKAFRRRYPDIQIEAYFVFDDGDIQRRAQKYDIFPVYEWQVKSMSPLTVHQPSHSKVAKISEKVSENLRELLAKMEADGRTPGVPFAEFIPLLIGNSKVLPEDMMCVDWGHAGWGDFLERLICFQQELKQQESNVISAYLRSTALNLFICEINILAEEKRNNELERLLKLLVQFNKISNGVKFYEPFDYSAIFRNKQVGAIIGTVASFPHLAGMNRKDWFIGTAPLSPRNTPFCTAEFMCVSSYSSHFPEAEKFRDFMLSKEAQSIIAKGFFFAPVLERIRNSSRLYLDTCRGMDNLLLSLKRGQYFYSDKSFINKKQNQSINEKIQQVLFYNASPADIAKSIITNS